MKFFLQPLYKAYRLILRNPQYRWVAIIGSLIYLLSPIDFATDVIPFVGWIDDGLVATLLVTEVSQILLEQRKANRTKSADIDAVSAS
ncbi:MAG: DUF1232 domain-containing protein [Coleofasciculus sp. S288]|nr:DUF1232 domain-containing protein [Coleofasciculus sp. S288]